MVVQKYLHDMAGWAALSAEEQEAIIGRTKLDNVEIDDDGAPRLSHKSLATIEDDAGGELAIFVGVPAGSYDRLLDFSTAITGTTFFAPTAATLAQPPADPAAASSLGLPPGDSAR